MIAKSKDELVAKLTTAGFTFSQFSVENVGDYEGYDADWNYNDVPHLNILHKLVNSHPATLSDNIVSSVNLQKVMGIVVPMVVVNYHLGKNRQTYFTSYLNLMLVVETMWESLGPVKTRVTTTYAVGSRWYLKFLHPLVRYLITKNYHALMLEDIPMRTRRGDLRKWGYAFRTDGPRHSFISTLHILDENMVYKAELKPPPPTKVSLEQIKGAATADVFTTQSDHWGLRFHVEGETLQVFPRLCPHEGACLDTEALCNGAVKCPWHGRVLRPLASIGLPWAANTVPMELRHHRLLFQPDGILVEYKDTPLAAKVDPNEQVADINL